MGREIKFRAWCKQNKRFLKEYSYPNGHSALWMDITDGSLNLIEPTTDEGGCSSLDIQTINDDYGYEIVLQQYTGLKDKNGKEIYEGDICRSQDCCPDADFNLKYEDNPIGDVFYNTDKGWFELNRNNIPVSFADNIEVIGNIYENPELLNKER